MTDDEYTEAATFAILEAITKVDPDGTGRGGYIRPHIFGALVAAIAAIAVEANPGLTLREKKFIADGCRKGILDQMKHFEEMRAAGESPPWSGKVVRPS